MPTVCRGLQLPDRIRVARARRAPEVGPRVLFFSGGTALRPLSRVLKLHTHNSIHLITPFDSGGSSAKLRRAFDMLSVGDLRNRLMALADETVRGNPATYALFSHRLPAEATPEELLAQLEALVHGRGDLMAAVPSPLAKLIRSDLREFAREMPEGFDLRGASIGNLILTGGYLRHDRDIESVIYLFSQLVNVLGVVRPIVQADLQLKAELADGNWILGQHLMTGKEVPPIASPIADLDLATEKGEPASVEISKATRKLIAKAELICYPMGSLHTSLLACLLPGGVGRAIARQECPKVYIPSTGVDPEQLGLSVADATERILQTLREDAGADTPAHRLLNFVLVDSEAGAYETPLELDRIRALGVEPLDVSLVRKEKAPDIDPQALSDLLLSFV